MMTLNVEDFISKTGLFHCSTKECYHAFQQWQRCISLILSSHKIPVIEPTHLGLIYHLRWSWTFCTCWGPSKQNGYGIYLFVSRSPNGATRLDGNPTLSTLFAFKTLEKQHVLRASREETASGIFSCKMVEVRHGLLPIGLSCYHEAIHCPPTHPKWS